MAKLTPRWDGNPPTEEDFVAWAHVQAYLRHGRHLLALRHGEYTLTITSDEGPWIETEHDREPLTDELAETLGMEIHTSNEGETECRWITRSQ